MREGRGGGSPRDRPGRGRSGARCRWGRGGVGLETETDQGESNQRIRFLWAKGIWVILCPALVLKMDD